MLKGDFFESSWFLSTLFMWNFLMPLWIAKETNSHTCLLLFIFFSPTGKNRVGDSNALSPECKRIWNRKFIGIPISTCSFWPRPTQTAKGWVEAAVHSCDPSSSECLVLRWGWRKPATSIWVFRETWLSGSRITERRGRRKYIWKPAIRENVPQRVVFDGMAESRRFFLQQETLECSRKVL